MTTKKPRIAFTIADERNLPYAQMMIRSLRKFHSEEELPLIIIGPDELKEIKDPAKFYRMTPFIAKPLMAEYDLVLKLDADMIITGPLDFVLNTTDYDIGTVSNFSRVDIKEYGEVSVWDISPMEYFNCGFVAMRSKEFVDHWYDLCFGPRFESYRYKEQDLLNILCHYGNYKVRCFDYSDDTRSEWYGMFSKGEWPRVKMVGDDFVLPANEDGYPSKDMIIKCIHFAGGEGNPTKMKYKLFFNDECIKRLDYLTNEKKKA